MSMSSEWEYTKGKALLTAIVLTLGGFFVVLVNFSGKNVNPDYTTYFTIVTPVLWLISFLPVWVCWIVNKIQDKRKEEKK